MKAILLIKIFLLLSISTIFAAADNNVQNGIKYYNSSNYSEALSFYTGLLNNGYNNFEVNYNIGCCYYKMNEPGKARFYFEKALLFNPFDSDLNHNLKVVYEKLKNFQTSGEQIIINNKILYLVPFHITSIINIILILIITALFLLFYNNIFNRKTLLVFLCIAILLSSLFFFYNQIQYHHFKVKKFVVISKSCSVYIAPRDKETVLLNLDEGYSNKVYGELNNFIKSKFDDGITGWIKKEDLIY